VLQQIFSNSLKYHQFKDVREAASPAHRNPESVGHRSRNNKFYIITRPYRSCWLAESWAPGLSIQDLSVGLHLRSLQPHRLQLHLLLCYFSCSILPGFDETHRNVHRPSRKREGAWDCCLKMNYFPGNWSHYLCRMDRIRDPAPPQDYMQIYNFMNYQVIVLFAALGMMILVITL